VHPSLTVDIPLSTCVVGSAGPQISSKQRSPQLFEFSQNQNDTPPLSISNYSHTDHSPLGASVCLCIYGKIGQKHLLRFVQHHTNIGFEQVIVGVQDSKVLLEAVRSTLSRFIEDGTVLLSFIRFDEMGCKSDVANTLFYQTCLYHAKGVSEYVGIWDIDEFWVPPSDFSLLPEEKQLDLYPQQADSVQQQRPYKIMHAMKALEAYQAENGCHEFDWCTHTFPSFVVHLRRDLEGKHVNKTSNFSDRFDRRDMTSDKDTWKKSIAKTALTFAGGFHEFGSCQYHGDFTTYHNPQDRFIHEHGRKIPYQCRDLILDEFGTMHHFFDLLGQRTPDEIENYATLPVDEYMQWYARNVEEQISIYLG
jgi:hypothetical protein